MVTAETGITTGRLTQDNKTQIIPFQLVDNASGHVLAQAVLAALLNCERHEVSDIVRVAMYNVAVSLQPKQLTMHLNKADDGQTTAKPAPDNHLKTKQSKLFEFYIQPSDASCLLMGTS